MTSTFEQWASKVWDYSNAQAAADQRTMEVSLADFRKEIIIDVFNEAGQKVLSYKVYRCWVSEYQALPDLDANANAVAIQHIKLENEGWIRDTSVTEQPEPSFPSPPPEPMRQLTSAELIQLWERAGEMAPAQRAVALAEAASADQDRIACR